MKSRDVGHPRCCSADVNCLWLSGGQMWATSRAASPLDLLPRLRGGMSVETRSPAPMLECTRKPGGFCRRPRLYLPTRIRRRASIHKRVVTSLDAQVLLVTRDQHNRMIVAVRCQGIGSDLAPIVDEQVRHQSEVRSADNKVLQVDHRAIVFPEKYVSVPL